MKIIKSKKSGLGKPLIVSLLLHLVLVGGLLIGSDFSKIEPKPSGTMVEAIVIDPNLVRQQAQRIQNQRARAAKQEQERVEKLRRESQLLEKNRKAEEERIRKLKEQQTREAKAARELEKARIIKDKQRREAEAKAKRAKAERKLKQAALEKAEKARLAKKAAAAARAAAEKVRLKKEAAKKAEQERLAKEKAAAEKARKEKERLERIKQERLAKEKKEQDAALNSIFSGLENESEQNNSARSRFIASELERYGAIYKQLISSQLLTNESFFGKSCKVNLRLIPAGSTAVLGKLSVLGGDSAVCEATKAAVAKVSTYPLPSDPDIVDQVKSITLTVVPN